MSLEKAIKRNVSPLETEAEHIMRLLPSTEEQRALTDKWILPYQEAIIRDAEDLRRQVDRELLKDSETRARLRYWNKRYPSGLCGTIRDNVLKRMETGMQDRSMPGLQALKGFVREGGAIQPFWGIDKEMYFQNAIQLGNSILDVANDTVDRTKEPVVFYPDMRDAPIKRIESFTQFADVASKYWKFDIYPNIYFPRFAPVLPVISIRPELMTTKGLAPRGLSIETDARDLLLKNLYTLRNRHLFGLSSDFLFSSPYSEKRLPPDVLEALMEGTPWFRKVQQERPDIFRITTDPNEARQEIANFTFTGHETEEELKSELRSYTDEAARVLRDADGVNSIILDRIKI